MSSDRLAQIEALVAAARRRLTVERAQAVLTACEELLRLVPRQERLW